MCVKALGWTEKYSAPEVHTEASRGGLICFASDVYAAAKVIDAVCDNGVIDFLNLRNFLNRMLSVNAQDRPRVSEALLEVQ